MPADPEIPPEPWVRRGCLLGPPGRVFYAVCAVPTVVLFASVSVPGIGIVTFVLSCAVLLLMAIVWVVKLIVVRPRERRVRAQFLAAPAAGLVVVALVVMNAPLHARWTLSRSAFESQVQVLPPEPPVDGDLVFMDVPSRLGLFSVAYAERVRGGVVFHESTGAFLNGAGFAYLPAGPTADLENGNFENPQFVPLGGPWYAWTASW